MKDLHINGTKLKIYTYPSPILKKVAVPVTKSPQDMEELIKNMFYTMYRAPGIGLAAPQIGISERFFVLDVDYNREKIIDESGKETYALSDFNPMVFINPKIIKHEGTTTYQEGCLSVPGIYEDVERHESIEVEFQDIKGNHMILEADGLLAICIQHEIDHLDGIVFIDHLGPIKKNLYLSKLKKSKKAKKNL